MASIETTLKGINLMKLALKSEIALELCRRNAFSDEIQFIIDFSDKYDEFKPRKVEIRGLERVVSDTFEYGKEMMFSLAKKMRADAKTKKSVVEGLEKMLEEVKLKLSIDRRALTNGATPFVSVDDRVYIPAFGTIMFQNYIERFCGIGKNHISLESLAYFFTLHEFSHQCHGELCQANLLEDSGNEDFVDASARFLMRGRPSVKESDIKMMWELREEEMRLGKEHRESKKFQSHVGSVKEYLLDSETYEKNKAMLSERRYYGDKENQGSVVPYSEYESRISEIFDDENFRRDVVSWIRGASKEAINDEEALSDSGIWKWSALNYFVSRIGKGHNEKMVEEETEGTMRSLFDKYGASLPEQAD